jgi:MFS family permease
MFMDVSSEAIHSLLPIFLVSVLQTSATAVGLLEGLAEAAVLVTKIFSGTLSDWLGKRKGLALLGYGMAAVTKPLFAIAGSYAMLLAARLLDRVGKGIRGAPRDAMVADLVPKELRGAGYGLRQTLDTIGAMAGPLLATVLMVASGGNFRLVFWIAVVPAIVSVVILVRYVEEPPQASIGAERVNIRWSQLREFSTTFWSIVAIGSVFTLARFSEAFLVLRALHVGIAAVYVPMTMVAMNAVYAVSAYPAGLLSDRLNRRAVLAMGAAILTTADLVLARISGLAGLVAGIGLWGLHLGLTQGVLAALVADAAPKHLRGTAFGLFNLISGIALLAASVLAGRLWDNAGPAATFQVAGVFSAVALIGLLLHSDSDGKHLKSDSTPA